MVDDIYQAYPPEHVVRLDDPAIGLDGVIVLHSTKLGLAAGGCRFWHYRSAENALSDAMRLAEGMSYKNALAGLPLGGGKAVLRHPQGHFDRPALFRAFGRAVAKLEGRYLTAEDVGTSVEDMTYVAECSRHVAGLPSNPGIPGGDPSPWTALGVLRAMETSVQRRMGTTLAGLTVAVQGVGHVGFALCELLHEAGVKLIIADPRSEVSAKAAVRFGATVLSSKALIEANADVFAPCALGGVLTADVVGRLRAKIVCGAANNQLADPEQGEQLADRGILYAPDYVVNAGGIINVAAEYLGWAADLARDRVEGIGTRLGEVLDVAERDQIASNAAADLLARSIIASHPRRHQLAA